MVSSAFSGQSSGPGLPSGRSGTLPGVVAQPENVPSRTAERRGDALAEGMPGALTHGQGSDPAERNLPISVIPVDLKKEFLELRALLTRRSCPQRRRQSPVYLGVISSRCLCAQQTAFLPAGCCVRRAIFIFHGESSRFVIVKTTAAFPLPREETDGEVHASLLKHELLPFTEGGLPRGVFRQERRESVINRVLLLVLLDLLLKLSLSLERVVQGREHRVVAVGILEHVDLMVGPPPILKALRPHEERNLRPVYERDEQGTPSSWPRSRMGSRTTFLLPTSRGSNRPSHPKSFVFGRVDVLIEAENGRHLPGDVDVGRRVSRVVRHLEGPNHDLVVRVPGKRHGSHEDEKQDRPRG